MAAFTYHALNNTGKNIKGSLEGESERHIRQLLRDRGLTPLTVSIAKKNNVRHLFSRGTINTKDLALLTRQLATLLSAGTPLAQALFATAEQTENPRVKTVLTSIHTRLLEGHSFTQGLREFPQAFSPLYCATVSAGEQSGHLDIILNRLADYTEKQQALKQKLKQAMVYPSIMTGVSIVIVTFLLIVVVPKMVGVFQTTGHALPAPTRFLIALSNIVQHDGLYFLLVIIGGLALFTRALRREIFKSQAHRFFLKIPVIGPAIKVVNTARFSRTLSILISAGTPLLDAMTLASQVVTCLPIKQAMVEAIDHVREGVPMHIALKKTQYFPSMSLHLIASGEGSGQLEPMLERAALNQETAIEQLIETAMSLFEPMMILIMGVVILFIVLSVMLPIFSMDQLSGSMG